MNPFESAFDPKTAAQNLEAAREAWQGNLKLWTETLVNSSQKNLEIAFGVREQYGQLMGQAIDRSQALVGQEQALFGQLGDLWQRQAKSQLELAGKLGAFAMETGRGFTQQAQAAQTQISELVGQATEMAVSSVEETTARANGASRARTR
jgi:hypothetical protein